MQDSFGARRSLRVGDTDYRIHRLSAVSGADALPYTLKILLENLLRHEDGQNVTADDIRALANWDPQAEPSREIAFTPARVILQDFTGVPAVVDLAAMRDAVVRLGGNAASINPLSPVELVIDHSVQVDRFGTPTALRDNNAIEFERNRERYAFLRWGQNSFRNFRVVPPNTGIVHQVNLEYLSRVVFDVENGGERTAYPDTLVGTDSHTTMINGLGILGWGVGGIEAEAAMLGQPITMLIPQVIGFELTGRLAEGATGTDLVLTVTEMLRKHGVVGKFVEFFGEGLDHLPLADRATIGNMSPEYGSTCAVFPIDKETLHYLELSGRDPQVVKLVEQYAKEQGLWRGSSKARYTHALSLDLGAVEPSISGPSRPQQRIALRSAGEKAKTLLARPEQAQPKREHVELDGQSFDIEDGAVVIAAITSCTNTSNPAVMIGAGLLARNAAARGLQRKPWVKTSLAPGSKVVTDYFVKCGLLDDLAQLGFNLVGYGCTTCIGNSGPLPEPVAAAVERGDLTACAILSGNRNFEGRIHPQVKMNFLASPPLVVAYALAGNMKVDLYKDPLGRDREGKPVYLKDIWPTSKEIEELIAANVNPEMFRSSYSNVFAGDDNWNGLAVPQGETYAWDARSTYVQHPPFFETMTLETEPTQDIRGARVLALLGDMVTTDHISPAGSIALKSPAGQYLQALGVQQKDFNSYGSRRGNHEVMMRGTFANIRLRNQLAPGTEGGWTTYLPSNEQTSIYDAAMRYKQDGTPLLVIAGKEYGAGSSRDWAAKGTALLGVKAVLAESFERIHRSNLIGMGVLPLQFMEGETAENLGLNGSETYNIEGLRPERVAEIKVTATRADGKQKSFKARVRIDTPKEQDYFNHGGILHFVLRQLARGAA
ncbi:MAG TPA: aconitate hydratase AcnA [Gammaproteobacteria bacterium]|nr:aconitate hydratase AcnA [Gammaproteobacteria bacterium]